MPVLGVDVGSSTSTVATILRGAIDIVLNDVSQRYTPTCVSYGPLQRIFGDQANTQIVSNFKNTCRGFLNVLGLSLKDEPWVITESDKFFSSTPFTMNDKGNLAYQVTNGGQTYTVEPVSVLVGYLSYLTELAESYTGGVCREMVMSYPSWFSEYQKSLIAAAVRATGSNCLRLVSEGFAMSMDYGMYRLKQLSDETATTVAIVNVGHSHTTVAIVDFFASYCVLLAEVSDRDLGGRYLEYMLMHDMSEQFKQKCGLDPLFNTKTRLKVETTASKVKKVLSANSEFSYSMECLMEDYDLNGNFKREDFENMCSKQFLVRLSELLATALSASGRTAESMHSVEVVGGITRVPCVQAVISQVFNKPISKTLNSDESVARGCVLQGAINSKHYMVRKYNVIERLARPLTLCALPGLGPFTQKQINASENVVVGEPGTSQSEVFELKVTMEPPFTVLASFADPRVTSKNQLPTFQYTLAASATHDSADAFKEGQRDDHQGGETGEGQGKEETTDREVDDYLSKMDRVFSKGKEHPMDKVFNKTKEAQNGVDRHGTWMLKFQFDDTGTLVSYCKGLDVCALPPFKFDLEQLANAESNQRARDLNETNRLRVLNDLETFVYMARDKVHNSHSEFVDPKLKEPFLAKLEEVENWLYENRDAGLTEFESKFSTLSSTFEPVENNFRIFQSKEQGLGNFFARVKQLFDYACGSEPAWVNVPQEDRANMANKLTHLNSTTNELVEMEKAMPKHNTPLFTMEQLEARLKEITAEMDQLVKKHKVQEKKAKTGDDSAQQDKEMDVEKDANGGDDGVKVEEKTDAENVHEPGK